MWFIMEMTLMFGVDHPPQTRPQRQAVPSKLSSKKLSAYISLPVTEGDRFGIAVIWNKIGRHSV